MKTITFAHLSDLHILKDYGNSMFKDMVGHMEKSPARFLKEFPAGSGKTPENWTLFS